MGHVCVECGVTGDGFKRCTRCKKEVYCSRACQRRRWETHKETCRAPPSSTATTSSAAGSSAVAAAAHSVSASAEETMIPETTAGVGAVAGARCDDGRLFHGIDEKEETQIGKRSSNVRYDYCSGCGEPRSEERPLSRCSRCNSVWYCSKACQVRSWRERPWGKSARVVVSWAASQDPRVKATVNLQGHCIVPHREVCVLLKEARTVGKEQEQKVRSDDGGGGSRKKESAANYAALADALHDRGQLGKAIAANREAIRLDPTEAAYTYNLGNVQAANGDLNAAAESYHAAIRVQPTCDDYYNGLGSVLAQQGNLRGAIEAFSTAARLLPTCSEHHSNHGTALAQSGDLNGALEAFRAAIRFDQTNDVYFHNLGSTLLDLGRPSKAIKAFRQAIRLNPTDPRYYNKLVTVYGTTGQYEDALAALEGAVEQGESRANWFQHHPQFEGLRRHPRFEPILERMRANR